MCCVPDHGELKGEGEGEPGEGEGGGGGGAAGCFRHPNAACVCAGELDVEHGN